MMTTLEAIAREALVECNSDCMTAVRRDVSGVKHLASVVVDRAPKGVGVTWGMVEAVCRKVVLG